MVILLIILQFLLGIGLLALLKIEIKSKAIFLALTQMLGIGIVSFVPFVLQLFYVSLTTSNIFLSTFVLAVILNLSFKRSLQSVLNLFNNVRFSMKLFEIPILIIMVFIMFQSVWRAYYYPPYARDVNSGPEAIADIAVTEHSFINSYFTVNLESTNNQFKPAFLTSLQLIYKLCGFEFGQVWLAILFICFMVFLYHTLSLYIHRLLTGILLLFFLSVHDMFSYSFVLLSDFSNAVFFCLATFFLLQYLQKHQLKNLWLSSIIFAIATFVRSETLVLQLFFIPIIYFYQRKQKLSIPNSLLSFVYFALPAVIIYYLSIPFYIHHYLPVQYEVDGLMNKNLFNLSFLFERFFDMHSVLIFGKYASNIYGYGFYIFIFILIAELLVSKFKFDKTKSIWLYSLLVIYLGLPFLSYLFPLFDIMNTMKRGLFKFFPLALFFYASSTLFQKLSTYLGKPELKEIPEL